MDTVGSRLRALRTSIDLSQHRLAELAGLTQSAVNRYENDQSQPVYKILIWYADYFNVSLDYIFCRTENPRGCYDSGSMISKMNDPEEWTRFVEACFEPGTPMNAKLKEVILDMAGGMEK